MVSLVLGLVVLVAGGAFSAPAKYNGDVVETDEFYGPIKKCPKGTSDEELSMCLTKTVTDMAQLFADGIPEIDLKSIDPYTQKRFDYVLNLRPVIATARFTSIVIRGLSAFEQADFKLNTKGKRMHFKLGAPTIRAEANYEVGGNIPVLFQMIGNGPASIEVSGGNVEGDATFKIGRDSEGREILQIDQLKLNTNYEDALVQVGGLFNKHPTLKRAGPLINRLINQYQHELYGIIKPEFERQVEDIVKDIMNNSFANMPFMTEYF